MRTPVPLVEGREVGRLAATVGLLDIANGMTVRADPQAVAFPNLDLTAHLVAAPGARVGLDTRVTFGADGLGLTHSVVHDETGPIGTSSQTLTVRPPGQPAAAGRVLSAGRRNPIRDDEALSSRIEFRRPALPGLWSRWARPARLPSLAPTTARSRSTGTDPRPVVHSHEKIDRGARGPGSLLGMHLPFDEHGILLRRDAIASGIEDDWLHRMVRTDELIRMRQAPTSTPPSGFPRLRPGVTSWSGGQSCSSTTTASPLSHASAHLPRGGPD